MVNWKELVNPSDDLGTAGQDELELYKEYALICAVGLDISRFKIAWFRGMWNVW